MKQQTKADANRLEKLRELKVAAANAWRAEYRRQKSKYEQRARRADGKKGQGDG